VIQLRLLLDYLDLVGGQDSEFGEAILARLERLTNPPRCPARPLLGGVRPLEPRMSAFPRFRRLHPEQQTWRPGGLKDST
jgi:hypothetical protein